jgi:very-short-patch-repair endonuclease
MGKMGFVRKNMVEENSEYRPEQLLVTKILRKLYPNEAIFTEHTVRLTPVEGIKKSMCRLDIAIPDKQIAIRMNGLIHEKKRQRMKDEDQRIVLEENGWVVIDVDEDNYPEFWNRKKYTYLEVESKVIKLYESAKR